MPRATASLLTETLIVPVPPMNNTFMPYFPSIFPKFLKTHA